MPLTVHVVENECPQLLPSSLLSLQVLFSQTADSVEVRGRPVVMAFHLNNYLRVVLTTEACNSPPFWIIED